MLEASSHGLDQYRLDGIRPQAALFTNLSQDHLDYHADMADYLSAKARLFSEILVDQGTAILNIDVPEFAELSAICQRRNLKTVSYGRRPGADYRLVAQQPRGDGQALIFEADGRRHEVTLGLTGLFQAENVLAALALAVATGADPARALAALPTLKGVPGRMEFIGETAKGATVFVDYAHKPGALETVLRAIRPHCQANLWVVVGCGGDRDRGKRPLMGAIAERLADRVIITDDNPRSEDPAAIRRDILAACKHAEEIGDREQAIARAVAELEPGDVLVVAGKGHETGQILGDRILPFDDRDSARAAIADATSAASGGEADG